MLPKIYKNGVYSFLKNLNAIISFYSNLKNFQCNNRLLQY